TRPDRDAKNPPSGVDPELDRIVGRCLSPDPAERYPSAAGLAADLRAWLQPPAARVPRKRWRVAAFAVVLPILLVGITLAMLNKKKQPEPDALTADWQVWAREELQAGRTLVLVDLEGNAARGAHVVAGVGATMEREPNGWWAIRAPGAAM